MATFHHLETGHWQVKIRIQGHPPLTQSFKTKAAAKAFAAKKETAIMDGIYSDERSARKMELSEAFDLYFKSLTFKQKAQKTQTSEKLNAKHIISELKGYSLANITTTVVADYRDKRANDVSPRTGKPLSGNTLRLELATLSILFSFFIKERRLPITNPVRDVRKPKVTHREARLTEIQAKTIENALKNRFSHDQGQLANFVTLGLYTGMRAGELVKLTTLDITERDGVTVLVVKGINSKNEKPRSVPLEASGMALKALQMQLQIKPKDCPYLFHGKTKKGIYKPYDYNTIWRKFINRLGYQGLHFHDLRHEYISRLYEYTQLSDGQISSLTGHTDVRTLKIYQHNRTHTLAPELAKAEEMARLAIIKRLVKAAENGDEEALKVLSHGLDLTPPSYE